jgi:beta-glucosidase/6-phospho-beta-glucosidase/beta-galactosidase
MLANVLTAAVSSARADAATPFLWGAATSSYQVEGGITNNDYDFFNRTPVIQDAARINSQAVGPPVELAPAGEAVRGWQPAYYRRDFDNARLLGLNSFRISLEWARLEPADDDWNETAFGRYEDMLTAMRARGLRPIVTLNHFTLPLWVLRPPVAHTCVTVFGATACFASREDAGFRSSLRGWENERTVSEFAEFARRVVARFGDKVDYWLTLNEPVGSMLAVGFVGGLWSPGFVAPLVVDYPELKDALHNLIDAHVRAYNIIYAVDLSDADGDGRAARVGFAHAMIFTQPAERADPEASRNFDYFANDYFLNAVVNGEEDLNYLNCCVRQDRTSSSFVAHPEWRGKLDFVGLNYYRRAYVFHNVLLAASGADFLGGAFDNNLFGHLEQPHGLLNDLGWEIYPRGLHDILMRIKRLWNKPVLITENGVPERADRSRAAFIIGHLAEVQRAMAEGADVIGYLHWSLVDNWELHENYRPEARFGLFHVRRDPANPLRCLGDCHRELTEGAVAYLDLIAESKRADPLGRPTVASIASATRRFGRFTSTGNFLVLPFRSYARIWEARTSTGARFQLVLLRTETRPMWIALVYWYGEHVWHRATVVERQGGTILRELVPLSSGRLETRDHALRLDGERLTGRYSQDGDRRTWTATRAPGVGLWRWVDPSPWGGPGYFSLAKLGPAYTGKFMTMGTLSGGLLRGWRWRELSSVTVAPTAMRLVANETFDLTIRLSSPNAGATVAVLSGTWTGSKTQPPTPIKLSYTGISIAPGEILWGGRRSDGGAFAFSESQNAFYSYRLNRTDQFYKERDETSVLARTFTFTPLERSIFGVTRARIAFDAGGRHYEAEATLATCLLNAQQCFGTWRDVAGVRVARVADGMPTFP